MNIIYIVKISILSLIRNKVKTMISLIVCAISILLLLLAIAINLSVFNFINNSLNNLNSANTTRVFLLKYTNHEKKINKENVKNEVLRTPHIEEITILETPQDNEIMVQVIVDNYRNVLDVIERYNEEEKYEVIIEEKNLVNVEIIRIVNLISIIALIIVIVLTYSIFFINIKSIIYDRMYEIALYKALGYQHKHILIFILLSSSIILIISFLIANILAFFITEVLISDGINFININNFIDGKVVISFNTVATTFSLCFLLVFTALLSSLKRISKISPNILLKSAL